MTAELSFVVGTRVVKNPETWEVNEFDSWGRGEGIGVVVESPFPIDDLQLVDVRWPAGRCFESIRGLRVVPQDEPTSPTSKPPAQ